MLNWFRGLASVSRLHFGQTLSSVTPSGVLCWIKSDQSRLDSEVWAVLNQNLKPSPVLPVVWKYFWQLLKSIVDPCNWLIYRHWVYDLVEYVLPMSAYCSVRARFRWKRLSHGGVFCLHRTLRTLLMISNLFTTSEPTLILWLLSHLHVVPIEQMSCWLTKLCRRSWYWLLCYCRKSKYIFFHYSANVIPICTMYNTAFTVKSTNYRGRIIDGTLHLPTFSQMSNVIGSTQNHVTHIHSFISCWQLLSHRHSHRLHHTAMFSPKTRTPCPWCLFNMLRYLKTKNLNYITGSDSPLWRAHFHLWSVPLIFFVRLGFKKTKMGEKRERWRRRTRDSGELKKLGGGFKLDSKLGMEWVWVRVAMWALLFLGPPHTAVNEKKMSERRRMGHSHETSGLLYKHKHRQNLNRTFYALP